MKVDLRILVVVLCFGVVQLKKLPDNIRSDWMDYLQRAVTECECETQVKPEYVQDFLNNAELTNDACLKCFLYCLFKERGLMDGNGEFIVDALVLHLANVTYPIATPCVNQYLDIDDPCEKAYQVFKCLINALSV